MKRRRTASRAWPKDATATCTHCGRSRAKRFLREREDESWECIDEVSCSEATQWR